MRTVGLLLSIAAMMVVAGAGWESRLWLSSGAREGDSIWVALGVAGVALPVGVTAATRFDRARRRRRFRANAASSLGVDRLGEGPFVFSRPRRDLIEDWLAPVSRWAIFRGLADSWEEAGLGSRRSRSLLTVWGISTVGLGLGWWMAGPLLGLGFGGIAFWSVIFLLQGRARQRMREELEAVPEALEALSAGVSAGLSLPAGLRLVSEGMPGRRVASRMNRAVVRLGLGVPLGRAVADLADTPEEEELGWMATAVAVHIRTGGDLGSRLSEMASIARERRELEREVQSAATQGGLSGAIVAALVPVSAAMLVATNPEYMRILLDTLPGQALLVIAVLLQMGGWALIRRLTRLEFSR